MLLDPALAWVALAAILIDAWLGEPNWLWSRLPHPVVVIGRLINALDRRLNRPEWSPRYRRLTGITASLLLSGFSIGLGALMHMVLHTSFIGLGISAVLGAILLAQRSLYDHVKAVADGLDASLEDGRYAVSMIVGRNPDTLDEAGVCRAAIESCAENFSDGITAPLFWFVLLGLPGLLLYKTINTTDSMIGHRSDRYLAFGWASARFDDCLNILPARLTGFIFVGLAPFFKASPIGVARLTLRDAPKHRSPSAGWSEAAMAGLLGLALAGPRRYGAELVDDPYMNEGGRTEATTADIRRSLTVLVLAAGVLFLLTGSLALLSSLRGL